MEYRENWENLANAIIQQAVDDYRKVCNGKTGILLEGDSRSIKKIEDFFLSGWFHMLTKIDGRMLIKRLRSEANEAYIRKRKFNLYNESGQRQGEEPNAPKRRYKTYK